MHAFFEFVWAGLEIVHSADGHPKQMALKAFEQDSFLEHPDLNKTKPGVPACQTCAMLKKMGEKKKNEVLNHLNLYICN